MPTITLSATPKGNGYQATVTFPDDGVSISSAEIYPTIAEAMTGRRNEAARHARAPGGHGSVGTADHRVRQG
jgi:hypothetical protein